MNHFENRGAFEYKGKPYNIAHEGGIVIAVDKNRLSPTLSRIVPDKRLVFDSNGILLPKSGRSDTNDMVSLSSPREWEKYARMFYFNEIFKMITIDTSQLIGPTLLAGNRILQDGEVLSLVPRDAVIGEQKYSWTKADAGYDYGIDTYPDEYDKDFFIRLVVNKSRGYKPALI